MTTILTSILQGKLQKTGATEAIINPYTQGAVAHIMRSKDVIIRPHKEHDSPSDIRAMAIRAAQAWSLALQKNGFRDSLLAQVTKETGSPITYHTEDLDATLIYLREFDKALAQRDSRFQYGPKGNILIILCANEPISVTTILLFTALLAGNTVYIKPSSKTPSFAYQLIHTLSRIPALKSRVHLLLIDRTETERLILSRSFDAVLSFGGSETSRSVSLLCAKVSVEFIEESEGCDWAYVDASASRLHDIASILVKASTRHNGQMCNAVRGIMVHTDVYKDFLLKYTQVFQALKIGDPMETSTQIGALLSGTQTHAETLLHEHEKTLMTPMCSLPAFGCYTTTSGDVGAMTTPVFAPIVWIMPVRSHLDAINLHNTHNRFGLGFSAYAKKREVIDTLTQRIQAGRVNINTDPLDIGPFDPMGGIRVSGRGGPKFWLEKLSNRKWIARYNGA